MFDLSQIIGACDIDFILFLFFPANHQIENKVLVLL